MTRDKIINYSKFYTKIFNVLDRKEKVIIKTAIYKDKDFNIIDGYLLITN